MAVLGLCAAMPSCRTTVDRPWLNTAQPIEHCCSCSRRRYSYRNLLELKLVKSMLDSGIKLESVRDAFDFVRAQDPDFSTARLVIADGSATLVSNDAEMIDVVNTFHGLGTFNLNLLMIDGLSGELDEAVSARSAATSPRSPDAADRVAEPHAIPTVDG